MKTEVLSIRVKKGLKKEADSLGIDIKSVLEKTLEDILAARKQNTTNLALELKELMAVSVKEWVNDTRKIRQES